MTRGFPDHFSERAARYAAHRPGYPAALVDTLAALAPGRSLAWDAGCGSGQLSVPLCAAFESVVATDASPDQLARATPHPRLQYRCAPAEASGLPDAAVDLAVAAQAAHWFDLPAYYAEVRRVARPGAIVALASYANTVIDDGIDPVIGRFYSEVLGRHWPPERRHVESGYRSLPLPFEELPAPVLAMEASWGLADLLGYIETWSAVRALEKGEGPAPLEAFRRELTQAWSAGPPVRPIRWPLSLRLGRVGLSVPART